MSRSVKQYMSVAGAAVIGVFLTWAVTWQSIMVSKDAVQAGFDRDAAVLKDRTISKIFATIANSERIYTHYKNFTQGNAPFKGFLDIAAQTRPEWHQLAIYKRLPEEQGSEIEKLMHWAPNDHSIADLQNENFETSKDFQKFLETETRIGQIYYGPISDDIIIPRTRKAGLGFPYMVLASLVKIEDGAAVFVVQVLDMDITIISAVGENLMRGFAMEVTAWRQDDRKLYYKVAGDDHVQHDAHDHAEEAHAHEVEAFSIQQFHSASDLDWKVIVWDIPGAYSVEYWRSAIVFFIAMILTGAVIFIFWNQSARARRITEMVERRTRALKHAQLELEDQNRLLRNLNSDLSAARKAAEAANKAKSEFLATVSHELRTPLNAILGFSQILGEQSLGEIGDPRYVDYAKDIHTSGSHLLSLINDILDLAKLEAGKLKIERNAVNLSDMLENVHAILYQAAREKGIKLLTDLDSKLPDYLVGDSVRLRQILLNLGSNAIKFTQEGAVTMRLYAQKYPSGVAGWVLEVEDTGIGIPKEKLLTLFDRFTQVDAAHSRSHSGAGLGLAICRELVGNMGGEIHVTSEENKGTIMWAHLPLEAVSEADADDLMI